VAFSSLRRSRNAGIQMTSSPKCTALVNSAPCCVGAIHADGNRVAKGTITSMSCDPGSNGFKQTKSYVLRPSGERLTMLDQNNNWQRTNVFGAGSLLATYDASGLHFHLTDSLGTRRVQTTASGQPETDIQSLPFGDGLTPSGNCTDATEHHFTGKERDAESGNDYFEARYYASSMGRFMSPDWSDKEEPVPYAKLNDPQSLNLYAYVGNNPLSTIDADGHGANGDIWDQFNANVLSAAGDNAAFFFGNMGLGSQAIADAAQQQNATTTPSTSTSTDPIATALSKVPGVASVTPAPDPKLDVAKGGHRNETDALTFKTPEDKAKFLAESGRKSLVPRDVSENGFGPGVRLPGGLHAEQGREVNGQLLVTSHIDRFNVNNGLAPMIGHFVVDVTIGMTFFRHSAGLDQ